jgi:hypothetical protein
VNGRADQGAENGGRGGRLTVDPVSFSRGWCWGGANSRRRWRRPRSIRSPHAPLLALLPSVGNQHKA